MKNTEDEQNANTEKVIYDIKGSSKNLTEKEKSAQKKWMEDIIKVAKQYPNDAFVNGDINKKNVALTFDDGPDGRITAKILDILKQNNVKGNFFFIGENVSKFPGVVRRADKEGNLILNHSYDHPDFKQKNNEEIKNQILKTENIIYKTIGKKPAIIRPPYGDVDERVVSSILQTGDKITIWSIDTLDWSQKEKDNIVKNVLDNLRPGDIVLMHSNGDKAATAEALPIIIKGIKEKGYEIVTLDKMLNIKAYK
jgi:Predicted xylanase/chitin deacetylase